MNMTMFLAQLWGPVLVAFGVGIFVSGEYYLKVYRDFEKNVFAMMLFGMAATVAGTAHILAHNVWGSFTAGLVSFLGWGTFLKGVLFLIAPNFVDKMGDGWANKKLIPVAGTLTLIVGIYLVWIGYIA